MRILNFGRSMGTGGAEKVMLQLVELQRSKDIYCVVCSDGGKHVSALASMGVKHVTIPDIDSKRLTDILKTVFILKKTIKSNHIDTVHTHHRMAAMYIRTMNLLHIINVKQINTQHNIFHNKKMLTRFALSKSTNVAVGENVKKNLEEKFGMKNESIVTITNSIRPPKVNHFENPLVNGHMSVVSIGRLSEQKGMKYLIQAAAIIKSEIGNQVTFKIIGDGELKEELQQEIYSKSVEDIVALTGYSNHVFSDIQSSNVVVLSSLWEGLPLTLIESFACGRPVIASNIKGNQELVVDGWNGYLVPRQSPEEIAGKIFALVKDRALLQELSDNAWRSYQKKYSYRLFCQRYMSIYYS